MRSLYFKIFLWFWLAMALVGVAFVVSTATLQRSEAEARWRTFVASGLALSGQSAIDAYAERGSEGLADYFERMERRNAVRAFLYDDSLHELSGREAPPDGIELARQALDSDELAVQEYEDSRLVAVNLLSPEGGSYVLLADIEWPFRGVRDRLPASRRRSPGAARPPQDGLADDPVARPGGFRRGGTREPLPWYGVWLSAIDQPGALAVRMAAILLTAGALCYGLARYLTAPVLRLRDATHRLAGGDLRVRVGPAVVNRRDELAELGRDFDLMAERIESLLTSQRQLLSDVSHELRSPLARLNVALALARQRAGADAEGPLDRIEAEAEQLNSLIGRVLSLARFESGAEDVEFGDVDLGRLIGDIASDADFEADPKGSSVSVSAGGSWKVAGNEALLRSAIENVVRNAVRYTAPGSEVQISLAAATPTGAGNAAPSVVIAVRDHGPGVPDDQLKELFKPFYRQADSRDRQSGGTGLGLAIAERAVRLHGGSVRAVNAPEGGLIVEIRLPLSC